MQAYLGEEGTEQFTVTTHHDGNMIAAKHIHDPFITCTTLIRISRWDLLKALFKRQYETRIQVHVSATEGAQRAIMTMNPEALEMDTKEIIEQRKISRETSPTIGYYVADIGTLKEK